MNALPGVTAVALVSLATIGIGAFGLRISRTTSDFYVASRIVGPVANASAISGEYLSAASFLGVAGLVLARGADSLWYPVGWTAGYLVLLVFVAAPLRRSGAYTLPDFAHLRVESLGARRVASALVVLIGVLYLIPQFQGAGLTFRALTGAPSWVGAVLVSLIVLVIVASGGMRSITLVQAFQYWLKLVAMLLPITFLLVAWRGGHGQVIGRLDVRSWVEPLTGPHALYLTYSLILATFLGTMGLPHVVVRFYTNKDGAAARRTTLSVLLLLSIFYV
ncbi:MAG: sodium:solute symporter family transporter, partial [Nocardioidaceae bacterium]